LDAGSARTVPYRFPAWRSRPAAGSWAAGR